MSDPAVRRWWVLVLVRIVAAAGAVFGLVLLSRAVAVPDKLVGAALVLVSIWVMAFVPKALAHRWRSPR